MKSLLLLRHAKSSWKDSSLPDHDRPLNKRGKRDAPRMGRLLRKEGLVPDVMISSTAVRARRTAELVAERCGYAGEIELRDELYHAAPAGVLDVVSRVEGEPARVLVVGHNPTLEALLLRLTGEDHRFPTAALAHLTVDIDDWSELEASSPVELLNLWRPKELPSQGK